MNIQPIAEIVAEALTNSQLEELVTILDEHPDAFADAICGIAATRIPKAFSDTEDYVTVNPTTDGHKFNVVIMRYRIPDDSYRVEKISDPLSRKDADALALSWSAAAKLEIR